MAAEWSEVRRELLAMAERDRVVRAELVSDGSLFEGYHPRMRAVHDANADRLHRILSQRGWPGEAEVGGEAADAAWLVAQHAIAQPAFQRAALAALRRAAELGQVPARQVAMLEDRILTLEGRPQRYGTQLDWDATGELSPLPIEDPESVDHRRRAVGLAPLEQHLAGVRNAAAAEGERPPADWAGRRREMEAWLRAVGWRD